MQISKFLYQFTYEAQGDDRPIQMPRDFQLNPEIIRSLSKLKPYRGIFQLILEWITIFSFILLQKYILPLWFFPLTVIAIATRQHAIGVMLHEAAHFLLLKNRKWNDLAADWLAAFPLFISVYGYRREHFAHHRYTGTPRDPDWERTQLSHYTKTKSRSQMLIKTLIFLTGFYSLREAFELIYTYRLGTQLPLSTKISKTLFTVFVLALFYYFNLWWDVLIYWFIPFATALFAIVYLRFKSEHEDVSKDKYLHTRTVLANSFEQFLIAPNNVFYHIEHHFYPSVPFYHLPQLHLEMMKFEDYRKKAHLTQSYWAFIDELKPQHKISSPNGTAIKP